MSHSNADKCQCQMIPLRKQCWYFPELRDMINKPVCPCYMHLNPTEQNDVKKSF